MNLADQLAQHGIRLNSYSNGSHKIRCPKCSATRKNKSDPCLSVTVTDEGAVWKCWNECGFVGGVGDQRDGEVVNFQRRAKIPPPEIPIIGPLSQDAADFFRGRGIDRETLQVAGIGCVSWFIPAKQAKVPAIAFPYRKPGGAIVNIKFRTLDKEFAQIKNGEKVLFGWDRCDTSQAQLVITEGEIDALSMTAAGIENAVSVPAGASDRKWDFLEDPELSKFTRVVLAGDADEKGKTLCDELARRFGYERCWKVEWPTDCKDANDVLCKYSEDDLRNAVAAAKPYPISGLHTFDDFEREIWELYDGGRKRGITTGWPGMDQFMTIRPGELSVVTGIPSSGKSEFVDAVCVNLSIGQGWTFAMCSFENPPDDHFAKLAEKYIGMPFFDGPSERMSREQVSAALLWARSRFVLIRTEDNESPTVDWILDKARIAVIRHGIRGLVIDPYNEIEHQRPPGMTETEYVSLMLNKVKRFARNHDLHVWFVAHPAKPTRNKDGEYPVPSLYDISGSANWVNKADIGVVVERDMTEGSRKVVVHVKKVRFKAVGRAGALELEYDRRTGSYTEVSRDGDPRDYQR